MKKELNVKSMKEALVNNSITNEEFGEIWDMFWKMTCMGFIPRDEWRKLFNECSGWYVTAATNEVRDAENGDELIWDRNDAVEYRAK